MKNMTDEQKAKIVDGILNNFDYQKVLKVMRALNWKWRNKEPSLMDLIRCSEKLLYGILNSKDCTLTGSGGFVAFIDDGNLCLVFRVEESSFPYEEINE